MKQSTLFFLFDTHAGHYDFVLPFCSKILEETCSYLLFLFFLFCFTIKDYHIAVRTVLSVLL